MKPTLEWTDQLICVPYAIRCRRRSWLDDVDGLEWKRKWRTLSYLVCVRVFVCVCVFFQWKWAVESGSEKKDQNRYGGNANIQQQPQRQQQQHDGSMNCDILFARWQSIFFSSLKAENNTRQTSRNRLIILQFYIVCIFYALANDAQWFPSSHFIMIFCSLWTQHEKCVMKQWQNFVKRREKNSREIIKKNHQSMNGGEH